MIKTGCKIDEVRVDGSIDALRNDLEYFARLGIQAVELPVHGLDLIRNGILHAGRLKEVMSILRNFDFQYSVHSPNPLNLMHRCEPELHADVFRSSLEFTAAIGSKIMVYHAGRFIPEETFQINGSARPSEKEESELLATERRRLQTLSMEYPEVTICVENARPYLFHSPYCYGERLDALSREIDLVDRPNVKINLDFGHLYMAACFYDFDSVAAASECKGIAHTHIHDNFGRSVFHYQKQQTHQIPFGRGDSHMPVGWGSIPMAEILSGYLDGYEGMLIMELRSRYFKHTGESRDNLEVLLRSLGRRSAVND